jgi:predicted Zn-dependent protease
LPAGRSAIIFEFGGQKAICEIEQMLEEKMKRSFQLTRVQVLPLLFLIIGALAGCSTVPVTGRSQLILIPDNQVMALSFDQYNQFLAEHDVIKGTPQAQMVQQVGQRIQKAVEAYLYQNGQEGLLSGYQWEFNLVRDKQINAFAMPGGKVVIYTGILAVTQNESGLATVMGHEIGHAIARHGNERMSQGLMAQMGGMALGVALSSRPQETQQLFAAAYGLGTQVGILLPYGRLQESEADQLGLIFMAMAGYDPRTAVEFWQRMDNQKEQAAPPEFLSTHPSHGRRIADIQYHLPAAMAYYRPGR